VSTRIPHLGIKFVIFARRNPGVAFTPHRRPGIPFARAMERRERANVIGRRRPGFITPSSDHQAIRAETRESHFDIRAATGSSRCSRRSIPPRESSSSPKVREGVVRGDVHGDARAACSTCTAAGRIRRRSLSRSINALNFGTPCCVDNEARVKDLPSRTL